MSEMEPVRRSWFRFLQVPLVMLAGCLLAYAVFKLLSRLNY
jgi:hypothetical protein